MIEHNILGVKEIFFLLGDFPGERFFFILVPKLSLGNEIGAQALLGHLNYYSM
jgi:hypothetical protein